MNGYVESGYIVILGSLGSYAVSILGRERAARRRLRDGKSDAAVAQENEQMKLATEVDNDTEQ